MASLVVPFGSLILVALLKQIIGTLKNRKKKIIVYKDCRIGHMDLLCNFL